MFFLFLLFSLRALSLKYHIATQATKWSRNLFGKTQFVFRIHKTKYKIFICFRTRHKIKNLSLSHDIIAAAIIQIMNRTLPRRNYSKEVDFPIIRAICPTFP